MKDELAFLVNYYTHSNYGLSLNYLFSYVVQLHGWSGFRSALGYSDSILGCYFTILCHYDTEHCQPTLAAS